MTTKEEELARLIAELDCDEVTRSWVRNKADVLAVKQGCRFNVERGEHVVWFFESVLRLYEGESAGQPFVLLPFARDFVMRLFGWEIYSERWKRFIRRFRMAFLWVPKKNGKSPLLAGILLYLLTCDGEMGAKVFTAARDGKQALIAHRHAEKMVRKSPILSEYLKLNKTTHTIEFEKTDSYHFLVCGDNVNSQEGLNGSCGIDEMHVVDAELFSTLEFMTASRSEPIILGVSTAGKDLESLGKQKFDLGREINDGLCEDITFLHVEYGISDTATDADLKIPDNATPEEIQVKLRVWEAANPGWGVTIDPAVTLQEIRRAQRSSFAWSRFKMYRGNQWQTGDTPFIPSDDWAECLEAFTEDDLEGMPCYAGLDVALTWDTTAFVLIFPWGRTDDARRLQRFRVLPYFWLPEAGFDRIAQKEPAMHDWRARGLITITSGNSFDEETFIEEIVRLRNKFDIRGVAYDRAFANSIAQNLQDRQGLFVQSFNQRGVDFVAPIEYFERAFLGHVFGHNGHAVLTWQARNVTVKERPGGGKLLDKPKKGAHKKIDGIAATVMGLGMYLVNPNVERNYYETHALEAG